VKVLNFMFSAVIEKEMKEVCLCGWTWVQEDDHNYRKQDTDLGNKHCGSKSSAVNHSWP
jgi:hypothetical protein